MEIIKDFGIKHSTNLNKTGISSYDLLCPVCKFILREEKYNKTYKMKLFRCTNDSEECGYMTNEMALSYMNKYNCDIHKCKKCSTGHRIIKNINYEEVVIMKGDELINIGYESIPMFGCTNYKHPNQGCNGLEPSYLLSKDR
jgi:hypothetical protein